MMPMRLEKLRQADLNLLITRRARCRYVLLDISMDLFNTEDVTRGFMNTAEAIDRDVEPATRVYESRTR